MSLMALRGVSCGYGQHTVLSGVDLEVPEHGMLALIGGNGSGKTTLLRVLLGLLAPSAGQLVRPSLRVGYVPQVDASETLFPLSALEVVLMGLAARQGPCARPGAAEERTALAALELVEAGAFAQRRFRELSGGQRQRVMLARGLAGDPQLLVLDEPVRGL
ncbi:MAG: metal ABC transporter ATP-binding protein, partial [Planctomycetota bacterium]